VTYQRKDAHYRRAKAQGFRARSAYKLAELDDRYHLLRKGDRVVDLGAWPGGWLQVALERVGPSGRLVGVDLVPIEPLPARNVELVVGDIGETRVREQVGMLLGGPADVVLSDVAPKLTGIRDVDDARCSEALAAVMSALPSLLRPGGRALVKVFMDPGYRENVACLRRSFDEVTTTRPDASRRGSAELYVIARGFRGTRPAVDNL
jgi:23S rRNA (uridine2552-2'-O)-methyltransferase